MKPSLKTLKERAKEFSILLPFMEGKEKGEMDRLIDTPCNIIEYGFLHDSSDGKNEDYVCFIVKEDPQNFYFGGMVLTEQMQAFEDEGYHEAIVTEGLPVLFGKKKGKNKREYTTVEFYPE